MKKYIPSEIETKWQEKWDKDKMYHIDLTDPKNHQYILIEFSYPSGDLHMGHWFAFAVPDILARFKRMQGFNVFFPNGFDSFGLPAENAAIKQGVHPKDWTLSNIEKMKKQFATMGASFDWDHEVITCLPEYYKWNQWIFLKMFEKGLAYKGQKASNWCPSCQTVLANENVEDGKCWRCGSEVSQKLVSQWFLKITEYAERLLWVEAEGGERSRTIDWPKSVREGQNNWIGKSEGMEIQFRVKGQGSRVKVYTVFPETIFGVTYMVLAPEHPLVEELTTKSQKEEVKEYIKISKKKSELERKALEKQKTGVFTGSFCINPVNGKIIPIWIADYVLAGYGTGAVMGVPGSDHRDFEFAKKYDLEIIRVIGKTDKDQAPILNENDVLEEGILVNSEQFSGLTTPNQAREKIKDWMKEKSYGQRKTQYHLHDWSISRQRYWGAPIPIIYCDDCGTVPVPEKDLPVELPYEVDYAPKGKAPLATAEDWVNVACPKCGKAARREVETMDTFIDSSWYFFRYLDPKNDTKIFDKKVVEDWLPLQIYFGGAEHTLGHTLYSRFFTKFFKDLGLIDFDEYANIRINRGLILGPDGQKMSKSRGNVVNPDIQVKQFGADSVRLYLGFIGPYAQTVAPWDSDGLNGVYHFLQRVWSLQEKLSASVNQYISGSENNNSETPTNRNTDTLKIEDLRMMHKTIKKVTTDLTDIKFNTAIASLMEWLNYLSKKESISKEEYKTLLLLLAPFAPHITEELWQIVGGLVDQQVGESDKPKHRQAETPTSWSIHKQSYPLFDNKFLEEEELSIAVQINGKKRATIVIQKDMVNHKEVVEKMALENEKTQKFLEGKSVKKIVYIPGKILSLVV